MHLLRRLLLCGLLWLAACATLMGPRTVVITQDQLVQKLSSRFPARRTLAELLDVTAAVPHLQLLPDSNRVAVEIELSAVDKIVRQEHVGRVALSFCLRYDTAGQAVKLDDVRIDSAAIDGLPLSANRYLTQFAASLSQELLQGLTVYRVPDEDLGRAERLGYRVDKISVTARGLEILLVPKS